MAELDKQPDTLSENTAERRRFLQAAGAAATLAPAAALLLSASSKQALAQSTYNNGRFGTTSPGNSGPHNNSPFP